MGNNGSFWGNRSKTSTSNGVRRNRGTIAWTVRPHGKLEQLAENLWWTWGSLPVVSSLRRSMVLARRSDGDLVVHAPIALDEVSMRELEAIGEPRYIIVPNVGHAIDAPAFKGRYPNIQVFAPRGGRDAIAEVVDVDGIYEDFPADSDVQLEMLHGVGDEDGALVVSSNDGVTIALDDALFDVARKRDPLGFLFTTLLDVERGPKGRISRLLKLFFVKDRKALREDLERLAEHPELVRLVVARVRRGEKLAKGDAAAAVLKQAAAGL
jgi:hypothetical protein